MFEQWRRVTGNSGEGNGGSQKSAGATGDSGPGHRRHAADVDFRGENLL
jgi:hypothetical protein